MTGSDCTVGRGALGELPVLFMGAGNLAWSLVNGLLAGEVLRRPAIRVTNRSDAARLERFGALGLTIGRDLDALLDGAGTVILATKPQDAACALAALAPRVRPGMLVVSAVAGLPLAHIRAALGPDPYLIRVMPNTSSQVGQAASGLAAAPGTPEEAVGWASRLFSAVGSVHPVREDQLDAVTAVSGSGPAYFYYFTESLIEAARRVGLDEGLARALAVQTIKGAAAMLDQPGADPAHLRAQVTSARGTTEAGLAAMSALRLDEAVVRGVLSAARRSREISDSFGLPVSRQVTTTGEW